MNHVQTINRINMSVPLTDRYVQCTYNDEHWWTAFLYSSIVQSWYSWVWPEYRWVQELCIKEMFRKGIRGGSFPVAFSHVRVYTSLSTVYTWSNTVYTLPDTVYTCFWRNGTGKLSPQIPLLYLLYTLLIYQFAMYIPNCHSMRNSIVYTEYMAVQTSTKLNYSGITFITPWDFKIHSMNPDEPCIQVMYIPCTIYVMYIQCTTMYEPCSYSSEQYEICSDMYMTSCHVQTCRYIDINTPV